MGRRMSPGDGKIPVDGDTIVVGAAVSLIAAGAATIVSGSWLPLICVSAALLATRRYLNRC